MLSLAPDNKVHRVPSAGQSLEQFNKAWADFATDPFSLGAFAKSILDKAIPVVQRALGAKPLAETLDFVGSVIDHLRSQHA